jgi:hypothetical protein
MRRKRMKRTPGKMNEKKKMNEEVEDNKEKEGSRMRRRKKDEGENRDKRTKLVFFYGVFGDTR